MTGDRVGYELLMREDDEAARLAAELATQHGRDCLVSASIAEMEITAKAKPLINTKTTRIEQS